MKISWNYYAHLIKSGKHLEAEAYVKCPDNYKKQVEEFKIAQMKEEINQNKGTLKVWLKWIVIFVVVVLVIFGILVLLVKP